MAGQPEGHGDAPLAPSRVAPLPAGAIVDGRFEIVALAGEGGMGLVYRALDRETRATVALKVLAQSGDQSRQRFAREAQVLSRIAHAGIVRYVGHGETPSQDPFLAMEWIDGIDLQVRIASGRLDVREATRLTAKIAETLAVLHEAGVVHRDVKPSNVRLAGDDVERPILLDLGVVRLEHASRPMTRTGHIVGTPSYMAPEQVLGDRDLDGRADVFALGCVLFECLTAAPAFAAPDIRLVFQKILNQDAVRLSSLREVPASLETLVGAMLDKDPTRRPDARAVAERLHAVETELPPARSPSTSTSGSRSIRAAEAFGERFDGAAKLGEGGFGVVYRVRDHVRGEDVALKTLREPRADQLFHLKREFRALSEISHPGLVRLHELFVDDARCFFTMDLVEGRDFLEHVTRSTSRWDALRSSLVELAEALGALHAAGKVHRDIKPSNVLVTPRGRVKILDFGLVADAGAEGGLSIAGTPDYIAPEQARGEPHTSASDWYSVGAMLCRALTGRAPPLRVALSNDDLPRDLTSLCERMLQAAPTARPSGAAILEELRRTTPASADRTLPADLAVVDAEARIFVGRDDELALFKQAFEKARSRKPVTVLVEGRSGTGKTALVQAWLRDLSSRSDVIVLAGRCYARETVPYKGIDSLVDALCQHLRKLRRDAVDALLPRNVHALARLFPVLERVELVASMIQHGSAADLDPHDLRRQGFGALRELLARIAERNTLVVFLDDLQWGDLDSASLLAELVTPPDPPPMLLIAAYRAEERETSPCLMKWIGSLSSDSDVRWVAVAPLSPNDASALAKALLGSAATTTSVNALAEESGGQPLFLQELARHARERADEKPGDRSRLELDVVLRERVERLSPPARGLLETVAVAGGPVSSVVLAEAAGAEARRAAEDLIRAQLLRGAGVKGDEIFDTFHDRVRETVLAALPAVRRRTCHGRLGSAFEKSGNSDAETLFVHYRGAGDDARAAEWAERAGNDAAKALAFDRAARLFREAIDLAHPEGEERAALHARLGDALFNAARLPEAASALLVAADGVNDAICALDRRRRAAEALLVSGHIDEGREIARVVMASVGLRLARYPLFALLSFVGHALFFHVRGFAYPARRASEAAPEVLQRLDTAWSTSIGLMLTDSFRFAALAGGALRLALRAGDPWRLFRVYAGFHVLMTVGRPRSPRANQRVDLLGKMSADLGTPLARAWFQGVSGIIAFNLGQWAKVAACHEAERTFREECHGVAPEIGVCRTFYAWSLFFTGEFSRQRAVVFQSLAESRERGNLFIMNAMRTCTGPVAWLSRNDVETTRREVADARAGWSVDGFQNQHYWFLMAEGYVDLYDGDGHVIWERLAADWSRVWWSGLMSFHSIRYTLRLLRAQAAAACARVSDPAKKKRLLHDLDIQTRRLRRIPVASAPECADLMVASAAFLRGDTPRAASLLRALPARFEALDMKGFAAAAKRRLGEITDGDEGARLRDEADAFFASEGCVDPVRMTRMLAPGFTT